MCVVEGEAVEMGRSLQPKIATGQMLKERPSLVANRPRKNKNVGINIY